jgi:hypothetical protein
MPFPVFLVSLFACCHLISPLVSETNRDDSLWTISPPVFLPLI